MNASGLPATCNDRMGHHQALNLQLQLAERGARRPTSPTADPARELVAELFVDVRETVPACGEQGEFDFGIAVRSLFARISALRFEVRGELPTGWPATRWPIACCVASRSNHQHPQAQRRHADDPHICRDRWRIPADAARQRPAAARQCPSRATAGWHAAPGGRTQWRCRLVCRPGWLHRGNPGAAAGRVTRRLSEFLHSRQAIRGGFAGAASGAVWWIAAQNMHARKSISVWGDSSCDRVVFPVACCRCCSPCCCRRPLRPPASARPTPPSERVLYGDFYTYSLPIPAWRYSLQFGGGVGPGNPYYVDSTPGSIKDDVVIATGANGVPVNTNVAGMNDAYQTPNGNGGLPYFSTGRAGLTHRLGWADGAADQAAPERLRLR